jgi:hypothetical protein
MWICEPCGAEVGGSGVGGGFGLSRRVVLSTRRWCGAAEKLVVLAIGVAVIVVSIFDLLD